MEVYDGTCCQIMVQVTLAKPVLDDLIQIARAGYVFDSGGYGLAALRGADALVLASGSGTKASGAVCAQHGQNLIG